MLSGFGIWPISLAAFARETHFLNVDLMEGRVFVQRDMLDAAAQFGEVTALVLLPEQREFRAEQRGVAGRCDLVERKTQQADAPGAGAVDVIAKRAGQVEPREVFRFGVPLAEQQPDARGDGALGKLEFADVRLREFHRFGEGPGVAFGQPPVGTDSAQVEAGGDGVHEATAAQAARRGVAQHAALQLAVSDADFGDRAGGGPHPHRNPRALEGRAGRRGSAEQAVSVADHNLAIRAEVHQSGELAALVQPGGEHAGEDVAADEAAEAGQKTHDGARQIPAEFRSRENL